MKALGARVKGFAVPLTRDKADTLLLLAGAVLVLAPHAAHLPLWISLTSVLTLLWRLTITVRGTRLPPMLVLLPIAVAAMAGVQFSFTTLLGRDAGVAMLVLLLAFKMLEMHARRDLFVVLFLCYFLVLTNFFYSQTIGTALMMIVSLTVLLTAQLSYQYTDAVPPLRQRLRLVVSMLGAAAPFALLLFFLFPRIQGPLWGMPNDASAGQTGLSDSMSPGSVSSLAQSDELAFSVRFIDRAPSPAAMYWRGLVLGNFDGRSWTQLSPNARRPPASVEVRGPVLRHEITLEPSGSRWLFALELPARLPALRDYSASASPELEMLASRAIHQRIRYEAASYLDHTIDAALATADQAPWLQLPPHSNPRALALARSLLADADPARRVTAVLSRFRRQPFVYTLEPPLLGKHPVDEFLFDTRAGFCEHYAGAFVFLMRAAGVPARVVAGYQGGEFNPADGYLAVRQSEAHAWAEVWLAGRGWVRVDPTAAVAPERIQRGIGRVLERPAPFGIEGLRRLAALGSDPDSFIAQVRNRIAAINNGWNQWVLNYTPRRQQELVGSLSDTLSNWRTGAALLLVAVLLLLGRSLRRRGMTDPVDALYSNLCQRLARSGAERAIDEGPQAYARRVAQLALAPQKKDAALRFLALYSHYKYSASRPEPHLVNTLKSLLAKSR